MALLLGIAVFSIVPFLLQLLYIPITATHVFVALGIATVLLNIRIKRSWLQWQEFFSNFRISVKLYEIPFLASITFIIFVSVWRCFYYPPLPRDLTSGPEVIAEFTTKEYTMLNSVFSIDLSTTSNPFKPPFITSLQVIYKYAGFPFGQIWLCTVFISLVLFLYEVLIQKLHRLLVGILVLFFLAIPEMYAYTILVLFDYSNAVFFFLTTYFLFSWFEKKESRYLLFSGLLTGIATYIRSETLVLSFFFIPLIIYHQVFVQQRKSMVAIAGRCMAFLAPAILLYLLSITIYINYYLPVKYSIDNQLNQHLSNIGAFFTRLHEINSHLLTGKDA